MKRIFEIQQELVVEKTEKQASYMYRTLLSTEKALLPKLGAKGLAMTLPCTTEQRANGTYVIGYCKVWDAKTGTLLMETTYPTLDQNAMIKGGQGTGAACTYAKKGAIDSMFLLDANNPDLLDLDDLDGMERAAQRTEDKAAKSYEDRVAEAMAKIEQAADADAIKAVADEYGDVKNDQRVKVAGNDKYARIKAGKQ